MDGALVSGIVDGGTRKVLCRLRLEKRLNRIDISTHVLGQKRLTHIRRNGVKSAGANNIEAFVLGLCIKLQLNLFLH